MGRLFGTDGVRGVANADLTAEMALGLSVAAAHVLAEAGTFEGHRPVAIVGRDPRASGAGPASGRMPRGRDQRLLYWGALRAFLRPAFLRSGTRASRVRKPAFFSVGRFSSCLLYTSPSPRDS